MAAIRENREKWDKYHWPQNGDEWSKPWGDSNQVWWAHLFPRIGRFLPADSILEIAPGCGRWTRYLQQFTGRYVGVDVAEKAVDTARTEFPHLQFFLNDGASLPMIDDSSISFCFSYDSLVHVDCGVMESYIKELSRILTDSGTAFIHHSNLGAYRRALRFKTFSAQLMPSDRVKKLLRLVPETNWRDPQVTADLVRKYCSCVGLSCRQELITWIGTDNLMTDCFTLISRRPIKYVLAENSAFASLASVSRRCCEHYAI